LDDFDIIESRFLQLQKLRGLLEMLLEVLRSQPVRYPITRRMRETYHEMLQLQGAFGHIMALAPLLNSGDVVVDLQPTLPGEEVPPHEKVVESRHTYKTEQFRDRLSDDRIFQIVGLHCPEDIVQQTQQVVHAVRGS
jgi:hypothetical protein